MRKLSIFFAAFLCSVSSASAVLAHLPYLEEGKTEITVKDPEISKAYYGWLSGRPAVYSISSPNPFLLYLGILSPHEEDSRMDFSADIYKDGEPLAKMSGADAFWLVEYEPFANDYYAKGPEYELPVPAGDYRIEVRNSGDSGNYVLAVGKSEDLSLGQFARTLAVLPRIKEQFWGKAWWEAYNNLVGLFAFVLLVLLMVIIYFVVSIIRRRKLKANLDNEYQNHRRARREDRGGPFGGQGI